MKLTELECKNCGAPLRLESDKFAVCDSCGARYALEKEEENPKYNWKDSRYYYAAEEALKKSKPKDRTSSHWLPITIVIVMTLVVFSFVLMRVFVGLALRSGGGTSVTQEESLIPQSDAMVSFLTQALGKEIEEVTQDDLDSFTYLSIERHWDTSQLVFSYSQVPLDHPLDPEEETTSQISMSADTLMEYEEVQGFHNLQVLLIPQGTIWNSEYSPCSLKEMKSLIAFESYNTIEQMVDFLPTKQIRVLFVLDDIGAEADFTPFLSLEKLILGQAGEPGNLSTLEKLPRLETLAISFGGDDREDYSFLTKLSSLKNLQIVYGDKLKTISFVKNMPELTSFYLSSTQVKDLSPLTSCTKLTSLSLVDNTEIEDYRVVGELSSLTDLNIKSVYLSQLPSFQSLNELEELKISYLKDMKELSGLTKLKSLDLYESAVTQISSLKKVKNLESFSMVGGSVGSTKEMIETLESMTKLTSVTLDGVSGPWESPWDLKSMFTSPKLTTLVLSDIMVLFNFSKMKDNTAMKKLTLSRVTFAENFTGSGTDYFSAEDWDPVDASKVEKVLKHFTAITDLSVNHQEIKDISFLSSMPELKNVNLDDNYIEDISLLKEKEGLIYSVQENSILEK